MNFEKEIFAVGDYGEKGVYSQAELDQIVENYNTEYHEAPIVLDHTQYDGQAFGWVESLKRVGDKIVAKFRQVSSDFMDKLKSGQFKKNSVELYKDLDGKGLYLKRVAFLGAATPHVKGLSDAKFTMPEGKTETIIFSYQSEVDEMEKDTKPDVQETPENSINFEEIKAQARKEAEAEFAEKLAAKEEELQKLKQTQEREKMIEFTEGLSKDGNLPPAILGGGKSGKPHLADVLLSIPDDVAFDDTTINPRQELMDRFETLGKLAIFEEIAPGRNDKGLPSDVDFDYRVMEYCNDNALNYDDFSDYRKAANVVVKQGGYE